MRYHRGWEDGIRSELPCKWCQGIGVFRTSDIVAACLKCNKCRECGRDRHDPCAECRQWDEENRGEDGKINLMEVRKRRGDGE